MTQKLAAGQTAAGKIVALQVDDQGRLQTSGGGGGGTAGANNKAGVTVADTTPDFLQAKLAAGANVTLTVLTPGANERLSIAATPGPNNKAAVSAGDTTPDFLQPKLVAGANISITLTGPGTNEKLTIAASASPNNKAAVSAADTTPDFLGAKVVAGAGVTVTVVNPGVNETLSIAAPAPVAPSFPAEDDAGNVTGAQNVSLAASLTRRLTLTGNATVTLTGLVAGRSQWFQLKVIQGGAGSFTLAIVGAKRPGGTALVLSTAVGAQDIVSGYWDGTTIYASVAGLAFA